jgi:uncharacterized protein YoxC
MVLSIALLAIIALAWAIVKIAAISKAKRSNEELKCLENSLGFTIRTLQDSVNKALTDMDTAADKLNRMIEVADDRLRQLQYYYEYGEELRPLVQPLQKEAATSPSPQVHALRHKEVHELSRKGWSAMQIAKHTGMSTDEVQLVINLMEISTMESQEQSPQPRQPVL